MQALANAMVHDVSFVTGGVSMATLPQLGLPEAAFVGRSNVGKSSLVNMLLGRRGVAYTSKTPGKTQQYNYFEVNRGRPEGAFHLVDFPGLGYARRRPRTCDGGGPTSYPSTFAIASRSALGDSSRPISAVYSI